MFFLLYPVRFCYNLIVYNIFGHFETGFGIKIMKFFTRGQGKRRPLSKVTISRGMELWEL